MRKAVRVLLYIFIAALVVTMGTSVFFVLTGAVGGAYLHPLDLFDLSLPLLGICVTSLVISYRTAGKAKENKE